QGLKNERRERTARDSVVRRSASGHSEVNRPPRLAQRSRRAIRPHEGAPYLSDVPQLLRLSQGLKFLERLILDLPDPLARDVEGTPNLIQRPRMLAAEPIAQLEHPALPVAEVLERLAQCLLGQDLGCPLVRRFGPLV